MAATRKITSHLIPRKSSPPCTFKWLHTETATPVNQPVKQKNPLLKKVKAKSSDSSITEILNEYQNEGKTVKEGDIISLNDYFRSQKNVKSALQLYDWVESSKLKLTDADQALRIDLLFKTEDLSSVEKYFNSLQESEKTTKTYQALLNSYCKKVVLDKALEIFEKIKELNYMTVLNYKNMLSLYHKIEQPEKVISLVQEMEEKHFSCDLYTYNMLMNSYAALKNLDAAEEVLERMESSNVKLDSFTYGNLATIFLNSGLHIKSKTYLAMMEKTECRNKVESAQAACTAIRLYSEMTDLSGVNKTWESLKSISPNPNNSCYLMMLRGLSKLGELERLEKVYKEWEGQGCNDFDFRLPNVVLEYYLNENLIEKATILYESLVCRENEPNLRTLNLFITLCMKKGQIDLGLKHLEMGVNKVGFFSNWFPTEKTIKLFVNYFEETANNADRVEKFIQIMKKVTHVDSTVYDSLLLNVKASNVGSLNQF